jgi:hypothetical protein
MKLRKSVRLKILDPHQSAGWTQVTQQVTYPVWSRVLNQIGDEVWTPVRGRIWGMVVEQIRSHETD